MERLPYTGMTLRRLLMLGSAAAQERDYSVIGNPAAFRTNLAKPLSSLLIPFTPIQSLNGQSAPYPPGGGKNKFPVTLTTQTKNGTTFTVKSDGVITVSGTPSELTRVTLNGLVFAPETDYKFSMTGSATGIRVFCEKDDGTSSTYPTMSPSLTVIAGNTYKNFILEVGTTFPGTATELKMQLEAGASVTDWTPYSNICPISGWTGVTAWRTGINVWDEEWELGTFNSKGQPSASNTSIRCKNFIPVVPGKTYKYINGTGSSQAPWLYDINKEFISRYGSYMANGATITIPDGVYYIKFALPGTYGDTYKNDVAWNYPSTDTEYHAYTGQSYPVVFPALGKNLIDLNENNLESGSIAGATGNNEAATNRVRTKEMYPFPFDSIYDGDYVLTIPSGYKIAMRFYKEDGTYVAMSAGQVGFITSLPSSVYGQGAKYVRWIFAKTDDSAISASDIAQTTYQLERGTTATAYEPYTNTVYGGT